MSSSHFTYLPKAVEFTSFVVENIAPGNKRIRIFNCPIANRETKDLLALPDISEEDIRHSLLKGTIRIKLLAKEIRIVKSDINLLQFNDLNKAFLQENGFSEGLEIQNTAELPFLFRQGVKLIGIKNGINRVFYTPDPFINGSYALNEFKILVRHNGRVLVQDCDFTIEESGGPGTGFDTINMVSFVPNSRSELFADYVTEIS